MDALAVTEKDKWQDVALVDISYEVLNQANKSMTYREIFQNAAQLKGLTDEELMNLIPQVYTEMNLDGRFICISPGQWGLKKWYTSEAIEESVEALARKKGIDDDDEDYGIEGEDEVVEEVFADAEAFKTKKSSRVKDDDDEEDDDEEEDLEEDLEFDDEEEEEEEEEGFDEEYDEDDADDADEDR
ncbi:DNA-directed RNA polymerase subunit delta [Ammoniphilus oxalaticus]|uniref:Probable DNA-directed RNA polymerase subunit delta n=1 Tax=Ammoniphilus oxalaticus TaxID=66863 RepID=A0A419SHJ0_9BACL|nr:DNA-directed RNA polymerase subunit delta [Ammoniphilus oxalaticus]